MIRRTISFLFCAVFFVYMSGCFSGQSAESEKRVDIYFASGTVRTGNADPIRSEARQIPEEGDIKTLSRAVISLMIAGPQSADLKSPFPPGTRLLSCKAEDGRVTVDLSEQYEELSGMALTIADYCITLSLSQLEGVESVSVTVGGKALPYRDRQVFTREDVLLSSRMEEPQTAEAVLYFIDEGSELLVAETRMLEIREGESTAERIVEALIEGPRWEGLSATLPKGTKLLSVSVANGICEVSFSGKFVASIPESLRAQQLVIYSLVNTLTSSESIHQVRILVEGETESYYGSVPISSLLTFDQSVNRTAESGEKRN